MEAIRFKTGFIGAGNMGGAILRGFLNTSVDRNKVFITGRNPEKNKKLAAELEVNYCKSPRDLVEESDLVILGVKPSQVDDVLDQVKDVWQENKLLISMAAGVSLAVLESKLPKDSAVIRIMPNTPAQVGLAMTSISPNKNVSDTMMRAAFSVLTAVGQVAEVPEELISCVIGISGSSPAYTYMYMEALVDAAVANGMDRDVAIKFATQSVMGAAKMAMESEKSLGQLCEDVCSPSGTTIDAVNRLKADGFQEIVKAGFQAAVDRSIEMMKENK